MKLLEAKNALLEMWANNYIIHRDELNLFLKRINDRCGQNEYSEPWILFYDDEECIGLQCPFCGYEEYTDDYEDFALRNRKCSKCNNYTYGVKYKGEE